MTNVNEVTLQGNGIHIFKPVSIDVLKVSLTNFIETGNVEGQLVNLLQNKIKQTEHHFTKNKLPQAIKQLEDFAKHINKKGNSKKISDVAKSALNEQIETLISLWSEK